MPRTFFKPLPPRINTMEGVPVNLNRITNASHASASTYIIKNNIEITNIISIKASFKSHPQETGNRGPNRKRTEHRINCFGGDTILRIEQYNHQFGWVVREVMIKVLSIFNFYR
jgi:hypothetical protein